MKIDIMKMVCKVLHFRLNDDPRRYRRLGRTMLRIAEVAPTSVPLSDFTQSEPYKRNKRLMNCQNRKDIDHWQRKWRDDLQAQMKIKMV